MSNRGQDNEELVSHDDRAIDRGLKVSGLVLLVIAVLGGVIAIIVNLPDEKPEEVKTLIVAPEERVEDTSDVPEVAFVDVAQESGIDFVHNNGAVGDKLLPESLGGGVAVIDFDGDGDSDLLFVNSTWWEWDLGGESERVPTTSRLYRNDTEPGKGFRFVDVTEGSGLDVALFGMGASVGDFDNDGDSDIYLTAVGKNRLFRNEGEGRFTDITESAGVGGDASDWSTVSTWLDINNDGNLDLFVGNYVKWSREIDFAVNFTIDGTTRAYGPPTDFEGAFSRLYQGDGKGHFEEISQSSGIQVENKATGKPVSKTLGVAPFDFNMDGWVDILVANDTVQNLMFLNRQDGTFEERGAISGVAFDSNGNTRGAMGIDVAHFRNTKDVGIAIGNFSNEMTSLYVTQGIPTLFADEAIAEGIGPTSRLPLKFGIFFWDYDLDGWQDLLSVNGHLDEDIVKLQSSQHYAQPALLYWNAGGNGFVNIDESKAPGDLFNPIVGRGCSYADLDADGDLDLVFTQLHGAPMVLENRLDGGRNWLRVKLVGGQGVNRDGIGAIVSVWTGEKKQIRSMTPTRGYLSQSENIATFGLGKHESADRIEVLWTGGEISTLDGEQENLESGQLIEIRYQSPR